MDSNVINRRTMLRSTLVGAATIALLPHDSSIACSAIQNVETLSDAPDGSFSVIVIPDTQDYLKKENADGPSILTNPVFDAHTNWIVENMDRQRIVMVSHVGDIVERNADPEWTLARTFMDRLHGTVPYGISVGNHDMTKTGDSSFFQKYFPAERFENFAWYGGCFPGSPDRPNVSGNNANSFQLVTAEGIDLIFLHLECNAPDDVLAWADNVLEKHSTRTAMITTHMSLGPIEYPSHGEGYFDNPQGRMEWKKIHRDRGNTPRQMWDKCFSKHKNLMMICSGDQRRSTAKYITETGEHGNTVHDLLSDYSPLRPDHVISFRTSKLAASTPGEPDRTDPLRIYRFLPEKNQVDVITYDPMRDVLVGETITVRQRNHHQFSFKHDFKSQ